jgi:thioredoxin reductase (NADPH)
VLADDHDLVPTAMPESSSAASASESSMSQYLIEWIEADPKIVVPGGVEIDSLARDGRLEQVTLARAASDKQQMIACARLFSFIGAAPTP